MGTTLKGANIWSDPVGPNPGEVMRAGGLAGVVIEFKNGDDSGSLKLQAVLGGIRVRLLGGVSQTLDATVSGSDLTIQLGTNGGGTPTSTWAQVVTKLNAVAAALLLVTPSYTGDGSALSKIYSNWVQLSAGAEGSIRPPLEALANRTKWLLEHSDAWRAPVEVITEETAIKIRGMPGLDGADLVQSSTYTLNMPDGTNPGWAYLYAYWTGSAVAYELVTAGPNAARTCKTGDPTRRYLATIRVLSGPTFRLMHKIRDRVIWLDQTNSGGGVTAADGTSITWATADLSTWAPPHCRLISATLMVLNQHASYFASAYARIFDSTGAGQAVEPGPHLLGAGGAYSRQGRVIDLPLDAAQKAQVGVSVSNAGANGQAQAALYPTGYWD